MNGMLSVERSGTHYPATQRHIPEDRKHRVNGRENLNNSHRNLFMPGGVGVLDSIKRYISVRRGLAWAPNTATLMKNFFRRSREIEKGDSQFRRVSPSVRPSLHIEQLGSHWTDFH